MDVVETAQDAERGTAPGTGGGLDRDAPAAPRTAGTGHIDVPVGPFEREPFGLGVALMDERDESGAQIGSGTRAWLRSVLAESGVELGAAEHDIVDVIADEGWSVAQVIGGWVVRARRAAVERAA